MNHLFDFYLLPPLLVFGAGVVILVITVMILLLFRASRQTLYKIIAILGSVFFSLGVVEFLLRATETYATYMEKRTGYYWSPYDYNRDNVLWNRDSGQAYVLNALEYSYPRKANSLGFVDKEFTDRKDSNEVKILCLGDSFTEGDGSPEDSCFPRQMERLLQLRYPNQKITVMNCGICGSDPVFGYQIYDSLMYRFKPDIVIQMIAKQDYNEDLVFRGGFERYTKDGRLEFSKTFKYEKLYQLSFLSRIYFTGLRGYNFLFINWELLEEKQPFFVQETCRIGEKWDAQIQKHNFRLYFVTRPDVFDIQHDGYDPWFREIVSSLDSCSQYSTVIDLNRYFIDSSGMKKDINRYFWPLDGHNNPQGYLEMAKGIATQIKID